MITPIFIHKNMETLEYVVTYPDMWDWSSVNTCWMCNPDIGEFSLIPNIDTIDFQETFKTLESALTRVAELYAMQLN